MISLSARGKGLRVFTFGLTISPFSIIQIRQSDKALSVVPIRDLGENVQLRILSFAPFNTEML